MDVGKGPGKLQHLAEQRRLRPTGTPGTGNYPGGRQTAVLWADNNGNLWLFGGLGLDSVGTQNPGNAGSLPDGSTPQGALLNDLWQYNIATQGMDPDVWRRCNRPRTADWRHGSQQVPAAGFYPGSRWGSSGWSDSNGNLWFFGGWGYASSLAQSTGFLDDIWEYHTTGPITRGCGPGGRARATSTRRVNIQLIFPSSTAFRLSTSNQAPAAAWLSGNRTPRTMFGCSAAKPSTPSEPTATWAKPGHTCRFPTKPSLRG